MLLQGSPEARRRSLFGLPLRVALVHSQRGGVLPDAETEALRDQAAALRRIGCEVSIVGEPGSEGPGGLRRAVHAGAGLAIGLGRSLERELRQLQPHVVHVHDPTFAFRWLRRWTGPLIASVRTYPLTRAAADLSTATAGSTATNPLLARADRISVPSQLGWDQCRKAGFPVERLTLVPDFAPAPSSAGVVPDSAGRWAYVGDLTRETGIVEMLQRWPMTEPLDIVGDGELHHECRAVAAPSVRFLRPLDRQEVRRRMPWWTGLVYPNQYVEGAPTVYPDALAAGLPVVAWAGSPVAYWVRLHETGAVVGPGDRLDLVLPAVRHQRTTLRERCRELYWAEFSEERWTERTLRVYWQAAQRRRKLRQEARRG